MAFSNTIGLGNLWGSELLLQFVRGPKSGVLLILTEHNVSCGGFQIQTLYTLEDVSAFTLRLNPIPFVDVRKP